MRRIRDMPRRYKLELLKLIGVSALLNVAYVVIAIFE